MQRTNRALHDRRYSGDSVVWACWWWLRSPGNNSNNAANVNNDGNVNVNGNNVNNDSGGVRPALPHKPDIRLKVERIRAGGKGIGFPSARCLGGKIQVGGSRDADYKYLFSCFTGMANRLCHSRRQF